MVRNSIVVITILAVLGMAGFYYSDHPMAHSLVTLALQKLAFKSLVVIAFYWLARYVLGIRRHLVLEMAKGRPELQVAIYCAGLICIALILASAR